MSHGIVHPVHIYRLNHSIMDIFHVNITQGGRCIIPRWANVLPGVIPHPGPSVYPKCCAAILMHGNYRQGHYDSVPKHNYYSHSGQSTFISQYFWVENSVDLHTHRKALGNRRGLASCPALNNRWIVPTRSLATAASACSSSNPRTRVDQRTSSAVVPQLPNTLQPGWAR